ncbi:MAG TPA: plasmid pRiA4b ORF-3 family protein [Clostridiaceae bacterium]|nr:plasmid pRiA4b ORF-3 family protein [Clostridiaceae bacterium]
MKKFTNITRHIPALEKMGARFIHIEVPSSAFLDLFQSIRTTFGGAGWESTLIYKGIPVASVFGLDLETQSFEVVSALLLYLASGALDRDKLIEVLDNGYLLGLLKRLDALDEADAIPKSPTNDYFTWFKGDLTALKLRLELRHERLTDHEKMMMKRYGEAPQGDTIRRDILIPSDMPIHNLHYAIQKLFGWQNSHLRRFYLPDAIYDDLTGGTVKGWADLVGTIFQPPSEGDHHLFWDDDYKSGSINLWLKKKYTGPYRYDGLLEVPLMARRDLQEFLDFRPELEVMEPFFSYLERRGKDEDAERAVLRRAPILELSLEELHNSIIMENGTERLLERLLVQDILAAEGQTLGKEDLLPLTHKLLYNYDFGDNWEITITRQDHADDLVQELKASEEEIREGVIHVLTRHQPICLYREGLSPMDDVGGMGGYAKFLYEIYEGEDRQESASLRSWAKSMGWSQAKKEVKKML